MKKREKKAIFRKKVLQEINKNRVNNYKKDKIIINNIYKFIKKNNFKNIMIFIPLKKEVNLAPLIKLLRENRYNLYVPFMEGLSFKLVKYRLPLKKKKFGIKEPKNSNFKVKNIDLAIVPVLGIDGGSKRIGFGKGMYDRFYAKNGGKIKTTVFIERNLYITNDNITDDYDITADYIFSSSIQIVKL